VNCDVDDIGQAVVEPINESRTNILTDVETFCLELLSKTI